MIFENNAIDLNFISIYLLSFTDM